MSRWLEPGSRAVPGAGTRVLVAGLGRSGIAAIRASAALGADVGACDDADDHAARDRALAAGATHVDTGAMDPALAAEAELIVASPGIPPRAPLLAAAREAGVPVWSEVELGWRLAKVPVLGVTGTNGKTTTTSMLGAALQAAGIDAVAAGNIGLPLCEAADGGAGAIVAELSSFQLHHTVSFRPAVAVLLNLAPDHLDWHGSFESYTADKMRLFANQTEDDAAVVHRESLGAVVTGARVVSFGTKEPLPGGAGVRGDVIVVPEGNVCATTDLSVRGGAMLADAVAAAAAACAFGAPAGAVGEALRAFRPAEHRMELVDEIAGVTYINDSKATNPHATLAALDGMTGVVLIAGGQNKGLDLSPIARAPGIESGVAIGDAAPEVEAAFVAAGVPIVRASSMEEAVERATAAASPGATVLLSPACASFDMFADYRARGEAFRAAVKRIRSARPGGTR